MVSNFSRPSAASTAFRLRSGALEALEMASSTAFRTRFRLERYDYAELLEEELGRKEQTLALADEGCLSLEEKLERKSECALAVLKGRLKAGS